MKQRGKTLRLTSIALAMMMVFGLFALLIPAGVAGAAPLVTVNFPPSALGSKDTNNVVPAPDGTGRYIGDEITFQIKVKDYDRELTGYDGIMMELLDPEGKIVSGYALDNRHKMTKVDDTTYTYNLTIKFSDRAFYDAHPTTLAYTMPRTGMYSAKIYPYVGDNALIGGSHNLAAFWLAEYVDPSEAISNRGAHHYYQHLPNGKISSEKSKYWYGTSVKDGQKHYVGPEGTINVSYERNADKNRNNFEFHAKGEARLVNPFTNTVVAKREYAALEKLNQPTLTESFQNKEIKVDGDNVEHGEKYMLPFLVIDDIAKNGFMKTYMTVPSGSSKVNWHEINRFVTIDAKGPEIGEIVFSNDHWNGRKWNEDYVFLNSGSAMWLPVNDGMPKPATDQNFVEVSRIKDADSGYVASHSGSVLTSWELKGTKGNEYYIEGFNSENYNSAHVMFANKYHSSISYGSAETTQLAMPYDYVKYAWYMDGTEFAKDGIKLTDIAKEVAIWNPTTGNWDPFVKGATLGTVLIRGYNTLTPPTTTQLGNFTGFLGYESVYNTNKPITSWVPYFGGEQKQKITSDGPFYMHITGNTGLVNTLKNNEMDVTVVAYDRCGNKTEKSAGSKKFYPSYDAIKETRMESQNVLHMYVGQTMTKDDVARQNIQVWNTGHNSANASLPNDWYWYVDLGSENLMSFNKDDLTITANKVGEAKIYAKPWGHYSLGGYYEGFYEYQHDDYIKVIISAEPTVKSLKISSSTLELNVGSTHQLSATTDPASMPITWETNNSSVATVDDKGLVTGVADGTATIYAKSGSAVDVCTVTVKGEKAATGIKLSQTELKMAKGNSVTLTATLTPEGASGQVSWNTSDPAIATVDNAGKVTAVAKGEATITATIGSLSATCKVIVEDGPLGPANTWGTLNGEKIYYNEFGEITHGWRKIEGSWYFFAYDTGYMKHSGWLKEGGKWYWLQNDGKMLTGWHKDKNKWYWLKASGAMATGWEKVNGKWYYFNDNGSMKTGWHNVRGIWYHLSGSGAMTEGWHQEGSTWYYLTPGGGAMVTGRVVINGRASNFAASGRWLGYVK